MAAFLALFTATSPTALASVWLVCARFGLVYWMTVHKFSFLAALRESLLWSFCRSEWCRWGSF